MNSYYIPADPEHIRRERRKAQELRQGQWWKQQIGQGICHHCGQKFPKEKLTMEHLIPLARGGKSSKNNCVPACKECNSAKGAKLAVDEAFEALEASRQPSSPVSED